MYTMQNLKICIDKMTRVSYSIQVVYSDTDVSIINPYDYFRRFLKLPVPILKKSEKIKSVK